MYVCKQWLNDSDAQGSKKKRRCKRMQGFKGEVYDSNAKERAHHTHPKCVLHW